MSEPTNTEEYEALDIRSKEEVDAINLELSHIQALVSFGKSETGKMLIDEREKQVIKHINKLFTFLNKEPNIPEMISSIAQLKIAMRDLVDFKGSESAIEDRKFALDAIMKKKG